MLKKLAIASLFLVIGGMTPALATYTHEWEDHIDFDPNIKLSKWGTQTHTYTHDIKDDGFHVGHSWALWYDLKLKVRDDSNWDGSEWIYIDLPGYGGDRTYEVDYSPVHGGISLTALYKLNTYGELEVTVKATWGDFYLKESWLTVKGKEHKKKDVPEPAAIALMGVALAGVGFARRRRKS